MSLLSESRHRQPSLTPDINMEGDTDLETDNGAISHLTYEEALDSVRFGKYHYNLTLVAGQYYLGTACISF